MNKITNKIRKFYEKVSFPGYENVDNINNLQTKANKNTYLKLLNQQLPKNKLILEIGCGTGQLANFLGLENRNIVAVDLSLASLSLAQNFKTKNYIDSVNFIQMDIFHPCLQPKTFDITISNGVLHHTFDSRLAFKNMVRLTKPGGLIILGLYNPFGRFFTNLRRKIFKVFGRIDLLDYYLRKADFADNKKAVWFKDQYQNPHETQHTVDEILTWFKQDKVEFVNSVPKIIPWQTFNSKDRLLRSHRKGNRFEHLLAQLTWVLTQSREGGLFILIGKKTSGGKINL